MPNSGQVLLVADGVVCREPCTDKGRQPRISRLAHPDGSLKRINPVLQDFKSLKKLVVDLLRSHGLAYRTDR